MQSLCDIKSQDFSKEACFPGKTRLFTPQNIHHQFLMDFRKRSTSRGSPRKSRAEAEPEQNWAGEIGERIARLNELIEAAN